MSTREVHSPLHTRTLPFFFSTLSLPLLTHKTIQSLSCLSPSQLLNILDVPFFGMLRAFKSGGGRAYLLFFLHIVLRPPSTFICHFLLCLYMYCFFVSFVVLQLVWAETDSEGELMPVPPSQRVLGVKRTAIKKKSAQRPDVSWMEKELFVQQHKLKALEQLSKTADERLDKAEANIASNDLKIKLARDLDDERSKDHCELAFEAVRRSDLFCVQQRLTALEEVKPTLINELTTSVLGEVGSVLPDKKYVREELKPIQEDVRELFSMCANMFAKTNDVAGEFMDQRVLNRDLRRQLDAQAKIIKQLSDQNAQLNKTVAWLKQRALMPVPSQAPAPLPAQVSQATQTSEEATQVIDLTASNKKAVDKDDSDAESSDSNNSSS